MSATPFPSGIDWADGQSGRLGTQTPNGAKQVRSDSGANAFEETTDSPEIERGDYATFKHSFRTTWDNGSLLIHSFKRGTIQEDSEGNQTKILTASVRKMRGDTALVSHVAEGWVPIDDEGLHIADLPPDECRITPVGINPDLYKHPRYRELVDYNTDPATGEPVDPSFATGAQLVDLAKRCARSGQIQTQVDIEGQINPDSIPNPVLEDLWFELVRLYRKGITTFHLTGWKLTWTQYFFHMPLNFIPGGFIQDPVDGGLPPLFWSDDETPTGNNTLEYAAAISNPNFYADGISWLRDSDESHFQRSRFAVTRTWIGGPLGQWEPLLYDATIPLPEP